MMRNNCKSRLTPITRILALLALHMLSFSLAPPRCVAESYRYMEQTGTQTSFFQWQLAIDGEQRATITSQEEAALYVNVCDQSGATLAWRMEKADVNISAQRRENELHIHGTRQGQTIDETITLDDSPWFQPLSYSLRNALVSGGAQERIFWMIRPDKLKPQRFKAVREGVEEIITNAGSFRAVKVKICPCGLFSSLWHAYYWFRQQDGLFLHYEGTHGPPGTAKTVISLASQASPDN